MKCNNCENDLQDGSMFCNRCGSRIEMQEAQDIERTVMVDYTADQQVGTPDQEVSSEEVSDKNRLIAGKFRIEDEIGRGGMAIVYRALDTSLQQHIALKVLPPHSSQNPLFKERFLRESQKSAKLRDHPNIVTVFEAGESDGTYYIAMSLIEGASLSEWFESKRGSIKEENIIDIIIKIALAVGFAHSKDIIHRDIKPGNILMTKDDQPMLTDFGLAKEIEVKDKRLTMMGMIIGTPAYMSPEQAMGKEISNLTDMYSLGVVFYEMLSGQLPFSGSMNTVLHAHSYKAPPPIRIEAPNISEELSSVVHKLMAKSPEKRFQSGKELVAALESIKRSSSIAALERDTTPTDDSLVSRIQKDYDLSHSEEKKHEVAEWGIFQDRESRYRYLFLKVTIGFIFVTIVFAIGIVIVKWIESSMIL